MNQYPSDQPPQGGYQYNQVMPMNNPMQDGMEMQQPHQQQYYPQQATNQQSYPQQQFPQQYPPQQYPPQQYPPQQYPPQQYPPQQYPPQQYPPQQYPPQQYPPQGQPPQGYPPQQQYTAGIPIGNPLMQQLQIQGQKKKDKEVRKSADNCAFPIEVQCPYCNNIATTRLKPEMGSQSWLMCGLLCCLPPLCCIPYCFDDCKDRVHNCSNCGQNVGRKKYKVC